MLIASQHEAVGATRKQIHESIAPVIRIREHANDLGMELDNSGRQGRGRGCVGHLLCPSLHARLLDLKDNRFSTGNGGP